MAMTEVGEVPSLLNAVTEGDLNLVAQILDNGADIEERDLNGQTALLLAAEKGCLDICWELLRRNANVNARDEDGWTALIAACKEGFADIAGALLESGAKPNISDMGGWTPLVWASYKGHSEVVRELLRYGADPNERGQHNMTALIWAAGRGHIGVVKELLAAGAKAEVCDKYGTSALIWACRKGHFEVAKELIKEGANVDTSGTHGWTPLTMAAKGGFGDVLDIILEHRCNINAVDQDGRSALGWAAREGHDSIVRALVNRNAYINMPDKHGETPLIGAAKEGHDEVVIALLAKYADLEYTDNDGKTALYHAVEKGHVNVVRELLAAGANTEVTDKDFETPLLRGARRKHTQCVKLLLERGADITVTDKKGDSALHIAVRNKYSGLCEVLLKDPKNSRLLYKPNRAGETPYSIDCTLKISVLSSIFGSRQLTTDLNKMELPSAQDSFITAVADFVSEPSLSVPLTVGLYSRWGAGKSIVLQKLQDQIHEYANQEALRPFRITSGIIWISLLISITFGLIVWAAKSWDYGLLVGLAVFVIVIAVTVLARNSTRGGYGNLVRVGIHLAETFRRLALLGRLIYCVPPTTEAVRSMLPVHFLFVDLSKTVMIGDNPMTSLVNLAQELNDAVERDLGIAVPRLYRVFRAGPYRTRHASDLNLRTKWKTSCCCIPTFSFSIVVIVFVWTGLFCFAVFGTDGGNIVTGIEIATVCILGGALLCNIPRFFVIIYCLVLSMKKRVKIVSSQPGIREDTFMHVLKQEIDLYVDMLECLDGFTRRQTRVILFLDLLDSLEQQKVLHLMNSLNVLLSEAGHPFVTVITVDPRLLLKAIDQNLVNLHDSHISAYDYLKNVVDLPCYVPEPMKGGVHGLVPAAVVSQLADVSVSSEHDIASMQQQELEWDGTLYEHSNPDQEDDLNQRPECNGSVPLINNNLQGNSNRPVRFSNDSISNTYGKVDGHWEEMQLTQSTLATHEQQRISTDLSQLLRDNESGTLNDIKRTMNIVSLMGRLLRSRNIPFRWKNLASWVSLADGWPYKVTWLTLLCEDTGLNLPQPLTLRKLYQVAGYAMPVVGDPDIGSDGDLVYFETFLSSHQPLITVGEVRSYISSTFHIDPTIKRLMIDYLQAIKNGNISKPQTSAVGSTSVPKTPNVGSPCSSRFMWKGASEDQPLLQMTVEDICAQLVDIEGIEKDHVTLYQNRLRESNINGRVLAACDLNELRDAMHMSFGDWQLFKAWIYESRTREASVTPRASKKNFLTYHASQPGTPVDGSRSASTSEPPTSPPGRHGHDTVRSGGEMSATEGEDIISMEGALEYGKSPYGSHVYRSVPTRPREKGHGKQRPGYAGPSRQRVDEGGHVVIIHGSTKKALAQSPNSRQLNTWQRSADSGFASTEVDGQHRSKTLLRQTSVNEGREHECESERHDVDSSKTSSRSDIREYEDDNMTCSSKDNFEDSVTSQGTIPEIQVQIASPRTGSSQGSHEIEYFQPPPALADELRDILSSLPDSAAVVLTGAEECSSDPCSVSSPAHLLRNALASPEKIVVVRRASLGGGNSEKQIDIIDSAKPLLNRRSSEGIIPTEQKSKHGSKSRSSRGYDSEGRGAMRRQRSRDNEPFRELVSSIKEELIPSNGGSTSSVPDRALSQSPRPPRSPYHQRAFTADAISRSEDSFSSDHSTKHQRSKTVDTCLRTSPSAPPKPKHQNSDPSGSALRTPSYRTHDKVSSQSEIVRKRRKEHVSDESLAEDLPHPPKSLLDYRSSVESPLPSPPPKEMLRELNSSDSETFPSPPRDVLRRNHSEKPLIKSRSTDVNHQSGSPRLDRSRPVPAAPANSFSGTVRVEKRKPEDNLTLASASLPKRGYVRSHDQLTSAVSDSRTINVSSSRTRHSNSLDNRVQEPNDPDDSLWLHKGGSLKKTWPTASRGKNDRNHAGRQMSDSRTSLPSKPNDKETML